MRDSPHDCGTVDTYALVGPTRPSVRPWPKDHLGLPLIFSVICFVTGGTFTDPLACSILVLTSFVTPHTWLSILISFTSILFSWLFVVDRVSAPYTNAGLSASMPTCKYTNVLTLSQEIQTWHKLERRLCRSQAIACFIYRNIALYLLQCLPLS